MAWMLYRHWNGGVIRRQMRVPVTKPNGIGVFGNSTNPLTLRRGAVGTIVNDDAAPLPTLSVGDSSFNEGSAASPGHGTFTVTLSAASSKSTRPEKLLSRRAHIASRCGSSAMKLTARIPPVRRAACAAS